MPRNIHPCWVPTSLRQQTHDGRGHQTHYPDEVAAARGAARSRPCACPRPEPRRSLGERARTAVKKIKKSPHAPPRCRRDLALTRQHRPRRVRRFSCLLPPPHRCRRRDVAPPMSSCENAPSWGIIGAGAGRAAPSMPAAFAPPQPLPLLELLLPPARSTQLGRVHCQRRCRRHFRHWCGQQGEGGA